MSSSVKMCTQCNIAKPLDEFPRNGSTRSGEPRWRSNCNSCQKTKISGFRAQKAFYIESIQHEIETLSQDIKASVNNPSQLLKLSEKLQQLAKERQVEMSANANNSFNIEKTKVSLPGGICYNQAAGYIKQKVISSYYKQTNTVCKYNDVSVLTRTKNYSIVIIGANLSESQKQGIIGSI